MHLSVFAEGWGGSPILISLGFIAVGIYLIVLLLIFRKLRSISSLLSIAFFTAAMISGCIAGPIIGDRVFFVLIWVSTVLQLVQSIVITNKCQAIAISIQMSLYSRSAWL